MAWELTICFYKRREFGEDKSAGNVELIAVSEKRRNRLPTVGVPDSQETIDPTSNSSKTSVNRSAQGSYIIR